MSEDLALLCCTVIAACGVIVDSAEMLAARQTIERAFRLDITSTMIARRAPGLTGAVLASLFRREGVVLQTVRIILSLLAVATVAAGWPELMAIVALLLFLIQVLISHRLGFGLDGADQMYTVIWAGIAISGLVPAAGLALIAGQSVLSYLISGGAKLMGREWRSGTAPGSITATLGHGGEVSGTLIGRISKPVALGTMVFELGGPFLILFGPGGALVFCFAAAGFHLGIAAAMGLNNFVWAFTAALPTIIWLSTILPWT